MFWRPGFETFPMLGPGFATFPTQFHFNISQMRQPSFQESTLTKLSNQIDWKDFNENFFLQGFQGGPQCVDGATIRLFAAFEKVWHQKCDPGTQPVDVLLPRWDHRQRAATQDTGPARGVFFSFKTFLLLSCVQNYVPTIVALTYSKYTTSDKYAPCLAQICDLPLWQT